MKELEKVIGLQGCTDPTSRLLLLRSILLGSLTILLTLARARFLPRKTDVSCFKNDLKSIPKAMMEIGSNLTFNISGIPTSRLGN